MSCRCDKSVRLTPSGPRWHEKELKFRRRSTHAVVLAPTLHLLCCLLTFRGIMSRHFGESGYMGHGRTRSLGIWVWIHWTPAYFYILYLYIFFSVGGDLAALIHRKKTAIDFLQNQNGTTACVWYFFLANRGGASGGLLQEGDHDNRPQRRRPRRDPQDSTDT